MLGQRAMRPCVAEFAKWNLSPRAVRSHGGALVHRVQHAGGIDSRGLPRGGIDDGMNRRGADAGGLHPVAYLIVTEGAGAKF